MEMECRSHEACTLLQYPTRSIDGMRMLSNATMQVVGPTPSVDAWTDAFVGDKQTMVHTDE